MILTLPRQGRGDWAVKPLAVGYRWVESVLTPPYKLKGGKKVQTPRQDRMSPLRNPTETRFGVTVRTPGINHLETKNFGSSLSRLNLLQSRTLLRIAGVC